MKWFFCLFFLVGCKLEVVGDKVAKVYPDDGYADIAEILEQCPMKATTVKKVPLSELSGWICIPEAQAAKYRREYNSECKE